MEQIIITKRNGSRVPIQSRRTATNVTSARQNWTLNGDDTVDITVTSPFKQSYEIGDKITVFGRDYTLNRLSKPKKTGMHEFQYTLQFEGVQYDLLRATYDVTIDTTNNKLQDVQGDSLTGDLRRFLTVLIANANRVFPGKWRLGVCPDTASDITKTFGESDNCLSVLQHILGEFDESLFFDIAIDGGVYVLNILSKAKTLPTTLEFGKGNGLYMLSRDNVSSANIVTRLKVYGSASNITSKYRADRLCLPGRSKGQSYIEKSEAVAKYGIFEGRKHFENIKPTFTGHVQSVGDSVLEFIDPTISFDLNAKEADGVTTRYLIDGVAAKVHFNSGNLAGYEFEVAKYDHATHKITLRKFTDDRGDVFPSETSAAFQFRGSDGTYPGDEYKLVDIALPDELVNKAEADLAEEANKYYDQNSQPKVQYSLSVTKAFLEANFATDAGIANVFIPGDYVPIKDADIDVDKSVRIKSITRNILDPYDYSLTLSDTVTSNITNRVISDIIDIDKVLEVNNLKDPARARANWRSSREVLDMVFDPEGDYYTDKIKPNSIDTLALSVGAKSMQFGLSNTIFMPNYNGNVNILKWKGGILSHYAISDDGVKSWIIQDGQITLNDSSKPYYIYAKCNRNGENGTFDITTVQHKVEESTEFYYFWVGIVNSVDSETNVRTLSLMYGFTTINGRYIKTGRIESSGNGESYFDLDSNEFALGDALIFNRNQSRKLLLNGVFVQSQGGTEFPLPCYRGEWQMNVAYFVGDTVSYAVDGKYSLYQCYKDCKDIVPTDATYWAIQASAGSDGKDGENGNPGEDGVGITSVENYYARNNNGSVAPTAWSTTPPTLTTSSRFLWNYEKITYSDGSTNQTPAHVVGVYGATGGKGEDGVSIKTITEYYLATSASSGVTRQTSGWTTSVQAINATNKYLWNYECVEFSDNTFHYTDPMLIGVYGDKGDKGDKGESPALVFRGDYSPSKVYYGTTSRLDCVKYGNAYYIARIDAGTFSNIEPTNTAKWNAFGSSFESVATGLLLAENANIANLIFRNQRLESNAKTNGIPNFFLDGLKNIASFAAGNVVFDGASATLGWLSVVGRELLGFDDDGVPRLRLTPNALPTVSSASSSTDLVVKASGGDATFTGETDYEVSFEQAVHCYYGSEDMTDDIDMDFYGWVEFDIAEDNTLVDLSGIQFGCTVKRTGSSNNEYLSCSMSAYVQRKNGSTWENIGSVSLNSGNPKITIPKAGRIRISFNGSVSQYLDYDCSGKFTMAAQSIRGVTAKTEMIIAKDGFMAIYNSNYMRFHSTDGLKIKMGNYHFRVNSSGIAKSTDGSSWTNL